ncbi:hypothetical protein TBLA_0I02010 [Henningerozyma blattae CBS 6284]|uniref:Amino acid permease/ SLC12A domain-containing protein n=1 Tax=Henningerozyma blattae (strain ATCC 34711 / CBS 6284 / DSM 70876 / NBRC 10599 / NRRL Y-10934 / UCD 77-7) TaxID=1071380 RepID=I2H907_HENB6|nr:hypothetical protein TBLA_0I02010 [Tetrapisispora blattae CBS 6284]CCH62859.1 hypothetical protein TBLA_0I02010 [Tetrapisispora blattae CBS 6284]
MVKDYDTIETLFQLQSNHNTDNPYLNDTSEEIEDEKEKQAAKITVISDSEIEERIEPIDDELEEEQEQEDEEGHLKRRNVFVRIVDSFKRQKVRNDGEFAETETQLNKTMKPRHIVMISLGTGIGTGLLVGNGQVLSKSGPAGLVIGYGVASIMIYCVVQAAGELGLVYSRLTGNYTTYPTYLIDPAVGFAVSMLYTLQWLTVLPLQLVTAAMTIRYWTTNVNPDIFVAAILVLVIAINMFGAKGYAEAEFFCNCCKLLMMAGFVILGIVINCGGAGDKEYIGVKYWQTPGAFANGFKGVAAVFCYAAFSYGGIEVLVLTANEQANPRKAIPDACRKVVYRVLFLYMLTTIIVCFLVPYNSPALLGSNNDGSGSDASPFVIAVASHGVQVVPHIINAAILISVISVANSSLYSGPRLLLSLSQQGYAPKCFNYIDRRGRPIICVLVSVAMGLIAFLAAIPAREEVFTWLLAVSGLSQIFIWMSITISHLRFRDAIRSQLGGLRARDVVEYTAQTGYVGSLVALAISIFILVCQFWVAIAPLGHNGQLDVQIFFENYLAAPVLLGGYLAYKIWHRDWRLCIPANEIDLSVLPLARESPQDSTSYHSSNISNSSSDDSNDLITVNHKPLY